MLIKPQTIETAQKFLSETGIFNKDPESWHNRGLKVSDILQNNESILEKLRERFYVNDSALKTTIGELELKNPTGLAAGFIKEPHGLKFWEAFGFGYLVIGGIAKNAQNGNPKKRLFRYPEVSSAINNMGLPGPGVNEIIRQFKYLEANNLRPKIPIIANLYSNLLTKEDEKTDEFEYLMTVLYNYVDGFEINISCPNQEGVCDLQGGKKLNALISRLTKKNEQLATKYKTKKKTLLVKIAPLTNYKDEPEKIKDLTLDGLTLIAEICSRYKVDGIVATNTAKEHVGIPKEKDQIGGMSGALLTFISLRTVIILRGLVGKEIPIIGVGGLGFDNGDSGTNMVRAGATAIQLLTSFVMGSVVSPYKLNQALAEYLKNKNTPSKFTGSIFKEVIPTVF